MVIASGLLITTFPVPKLYCVHIITHSPYNAIMVLSKTNIQNLQSSVIISGLVATLPPEGNPLMMFIVKGNPHYTRRMQLVTLCTRVRLYVRIFDNTYAVFYFFPCTTSVFIKSLSKYFANETIIFSCLVIQIR